MKRKTICRIELSENDNAGFIRCFNARLLAELRRRGLLTEAQYQKGLALLEAGA